MRIRSGSIQCCILLALRKSSKHDEGRMLDVRRILEDFGEARRVCRTRGTWLNSVDTYYETSMDASIACPTLQEHGSESAVLVVQHHTREGECASIAAMPSKQQARDPLSAVSVVHKP